MLCHLCSLSQCSTLYQDRIHVPQIPWLQWSLWLRVFTVITNWHRVSHLKWWECFPLNDLTGMLNTLKSSLKEMSLGKICRNYFWRSLFCCSLCSAAALPRGSEWTVTALQLKLWHTALHLWPVSSAGEFTQTHTLYRFCRQRRRSKYNNGYIIGDLTS